MKRPAPLLQVLRLKSPHFIILLAVLLALFALVFLVMNGTVVDSR